MKTKIRLSYQLFVGFLSLQLAAFTVVGQDLIFAQQNGSSSDIREVAVDRDATGNIYTIGQFNGTFDADPSAATKTLNSNGKWAIYITKKSTTGSLIWAYSLNPTGGSSANDIRLDASGNIYIAIDKAGTIDMDPGSGVSNLTYGNWAGVVAKYNSSMQHQWSAQTLSGNGTNTRGGLAIDGSGNVFTSGYYRETFNPGGIRASGFNSGGYIIKYNSTGAHQWTRSYLGGATVAISSIDVNSSGNVIGVGYFTGSVRADSRSGSGSLSGSSSFYSGYITELTGAGTLIRLTKMGGTAILLPTKVRTDNSNNVIVAGVFCWHC